MAVRYALGNEPGTVRLALSPLGEAGLSLRALRAPARFPLHSGWVTRTRAVLDGLDPLDRQVLTELVTPPERGRRYFTPDFLTPYPTCTDPSIEDQLDTLAHLPVREFRRQIIASHGRVPPVLAGRGRTSLHRVVDALAEYWDRCLRPDWPRMRAVLEADVAFREHRIAEKGLAAMIAEISPRTTIDHGVVRIHLTTPADRTEDAGRQGLVLTPTLFTKDVSVPVLPGLGAHLMYAARGQGATWATPATPTPDAIAALIGAGRARLLTLLDTPTSTTALAANLGITPSAVNQQLQVLAAAGLLTSARHGRSVLYMRSPTADTLLGPATPTTTEGPSRRHATRTRLPRALPP